MARYRLGTILLICSLLFACTGMQPTGSATPMNNGLRITSSRLSQISRIKWRLVKMVQERSPISLVEDSPVTFTIGDSGRVGGSASINRYSGSFTFDGENNIVWNKAFIMTRMAGPPKLMQQERQYMQTLQNTSTIYLKDSRLTFTSPNRSNLLEFEPE